MPRPRGKRRALGPYRHGTKWQAIEVAANGTRATITFAGEHGAREFVREYNELAGVVGTTLGAALEKYRHHYLVIVGNKPTTWPETRRRIVAIVGDERVELDAVTPKRALERYTEMTTRLAVDTHQGCLRYARTFYAWAVAARLAEENPFAAVKLVGKKKKRKTKLRQDEAVRMVNAVLDLLAGTTDRVMFERYLMAVTALYFGARSSEISRRRVRDVDGDASRLVIEDTKTQAGERNMVIPEELRPFFRALVAGRPGNAYLFAGRYHETDRCHDHRYVTRYCVRPLMRALGLPDVTAHGLRGTFADLSAEDGLGALAVARNLGQNGVAVAKAHYLGADALARGAARRVRERLSGFVRQASPSVSTPPANETPEKPEDTP